MQEKEECVMQRRSVVGIVLLSIITCGIYYLISMYQIYSDINYARRDSDSAGTDILLGFITCGVWHIYCFYKYSNKLTEMGADDCALINVLLGCFGFSLVSLCIMQSNINTLLDRNGQ